ncbi:MAG: patatin-like phospholipase family protein [Dokdonella sp.]
MNVPVAAGQPTSAAPTGVSLVLGSGGARGYAHIGVIEELLAQGFVIRSIAGSSMGALVGGVYAAGKLDAYRDWVLPLHRLDVLRLLDWTLTGGGFIKGDRIIRAMRTYIGDINIEDLPISFTAVAVDLDAQREVWFSHGSLFDAIRASIAIPSVFRPHHVDGRLLVDGGLLNPLPVSPTLRDRTEATIAVDVNGQREPLVDEEAAVALPDVASGGIRRMVDSLFDRREQAAMRDPGALELFARSLDAVQETITRLKLAAQPPDLLITIPRNICAMYDFHRAEAAIEMGRQRTREALARWTGPRDHHDWRR